MRRIEVEQLDVGAIASGDGANAERDVSAEMRVGDLVDALAAGNDRLQRGGIEQHRPDLLRRALHRGLPLAAQPPIAFARRRGRRPTCGRRRLVAAHELRKPRGHQRQGDIGNAERIRNRIGDAHRRRHGSVAARSRTQLSSGARDFILTGDHCSRSAQAQLSPRPDCVPHKRKTTPRGRSRCSCPLPAAAPAMSSRASCSTACQSCTPLR